MVGKEDMGHHALLKCIVGKKPRKITRRGEKTKEKKRGCKCGPASRIHPRGGEAERRSCSTLNKLRCSFWLYLKHKKDHTHCSG